MKTPTTGRIAPDKVHETLNRHMLADGLDIVLDIEKSRDRRMHDARTGRDYLDMFSCFATLPLGLNHPKMHDADFLRRLQGAALVNPTNSDIYTVEMAEFVETFSRVAMPDYLPHLFLVAGGTLGVENALKAAFDWKVRRNMRKGLKGEKGQQVLHFKHAFHGRSGYTLSLTNTADPRKYAFFAKFDWPRVPSPALRFPVDDAERARVATAEAETVEAIKEAFRARKDDIACIIIEPIQAEGGDRHFRASFLRGLRELADAYEAMLIFDEVQTGVGMTGKFWAFEHFGVEPDMIAFAKKMQVGGFMAGPRVEEEAENVFHVPSRINSTWGAHIVDMLRATKILEVIERDGLVDHAAEMGQRLLAGLQQVGRRHADCVDNVRGLGLMCAFDLPSGEARTAVVRGCLEDGLVVLPCGTRSVRFRPALTIAPAEVDEALERVERTLARIGAELRTVGSAG